MIEQGGRGPAVEFETIVQMFDRLCEKFEHDPRPAIMYRSEGEYKSISYSDLRSMVERFADGLTALGVRRGDRFALLSENRPEWIVADMAIMRLGAINVSLYSTLAPKQIEYILSDSGAKYLLVSNRSHLRKVPGTGTAFQTLNKIILLSPDAPPDDPRVILFSAVTAMGDSPKHAGTGDTPAGRQTIMPDDLLTLIYTSGTTGNPKGVMLTHGNLASNIIGSAVCIPFTHEDRVLSFLPLSHSYERMAGYYTAMACGVTIAFAESPETLRQNLIEVRPTVVMMVPRIFERVCARLRKRAAEGPVFRRKLFEWAMGVGRRFAGARRPASGAYALRLKNAIADRLVLRKIREIFGGRIRFLVSGGAALAPGIGEFFEAAGITIIEGYGMTESSPVISFNRLDEYEFGTVGKPIPGVEVTLAPDGEILVRGANVMKGYWNDLPSTAAAIDREGWLHTGDIGTFNKKGFLVITDRKKHLFVTSGGKNIAPQPIENLFLQSDLIDQFVLIGDGRMFLTALVVPNFDRIREHAEQRGLSQTGLQDLANRPEIRALFEQEIAALQKNLANYERVRNFTILDRPLTAESGELTPTLKVRRKVVETIFKDEIDGMYAAFR
jgi:long-chain acyl-CoA synthetase